MNYLRHNPPPGNRPNLFCYFRYGSTEFLLTFRTTFSFRELQSKVFANGRMTVLAKLALATIVGALLVSNPQIVPILEALLRFLHIIIS